MNLSKSRADYEAKKAKQSVICKPLSGSPSSNQPKSIRTIANDESMGMDLSLSASMASKNSASSVSMNLVPPAHSRIENVLKHYQATATLSLNGPDWFLPVYNENFNQTANDHHSGSNGVTNPSILSRKELLGNSNNHHHDNNNNNNNNHKHDDAPLGLIKFSSKTPFSSSPHSSSSQSKESNRENTIAFPSSVIAKSSSSSTSSLDLSSTAKIQSTLLNDHYQIYRQNSLKIPNILKDFDPLFAPPPFPIQQPPLLTPPDQNPKQTERSETHLEGEVIACFTVGGEKRLCVPQIFNIVLRDFSLQQINQVIEELQINCSTCTRDQMEVLKLAGDIPPMAPSCGLITKTDAHRLCSTLLGSFSENLSSKIKSSAFIDSPYVLIYHECFGRCIGRYCPELYTHPTAFCIQCEECLSVFNPYEFVCHSHRPRENRTVHWGFDPIKWRSYLLPIEDLITYNSSILNKLSQSSSGLLHLNSLINSQRSIPISSTLSPCCSGSQQSSNHSFETFNVNRKSFSTICLILQDMKNRFLKTNESNYKSHQLREMFGENIDTQSNRSINKRKLVVMSVEEKIDAVC